MSAVLRPNRLERTWKDAEWVWDALEGVWDAGKVTDESIVATIK